MKQTMRLQYYEAKIFNCIFHSKTLQFTFFNQRAKTFSFDKYKKLHSHVSVVI